MAEVPLSAGPLPPSGKGESTPLVPRGAADDKSRPRRHRRVKSDYVNRPGAEPVGNGSMSPNVSFGSNLVVPAPLPMYYNTNTNANVDVNMHRPGHTYPHGHPQSHPPVYPWGSTSQGMAPQSPGNNNKEILFFPSQNTTALPSKNNRKRKDRQHKRALSLQGEEAKKNVLYGLYGSFQPPPSPTSTGTLRKQTEFCPRSELMNLTSSFRGNEALTSSFRGNASITGSFRGMQAFEAPQVSPRASGYNNAISSPHSNNAYYGNNNVVRMSPSPHLQAPDSNMMGGEASYIAHRKNNRLGRKSMQQRQMRQQSAQIFMQEFKGIDQPPACKDVIFLLLFLFHITGIVYLGNTYGDFAFSFAGGKATDRTVKIDYESFLLITCLSGAFSVVLSAIVFFLVIILARKFVQVSLFLGIALSFLWGTIGTGLSPKNVVPITGFIAFALSMAYAVIVWDRIPFVAANLLTAISGIKAYGQTILIAFFFQACSLAWSIYFVIVVVGVFNAIHKGELVLSPNLKIALYVMLGFSYYWTIQVFLNLVKVIAAGVIERWWYTPFDEREPNVVRTSFFRATFYRLGSICFGSLLVGPVTIIRQLSIPFRPSADDSALLCFHECLNLIQKLITSCVDSLADHFNPWAYTYIGLHGYGFFEAGKNATELFRKRGWLTIVTDDLVPNILLLISIVIGGATGCFVHLFEIFNDDSDFSGYLSGYLSFGMSGMIGFILTNILFSVISSSVNAVLVCFASSPVDFEENHPELSHQMRSAWREVWPGCMDIVDLTLSIHSNSALEPSSSIRELPEDDSSNNSPETYE